MSEQEFRIERCGGLTVYHPIQKQADVISLADWRAPHQEECDSLARPRADCDCEAQVAA